MLAVLALVIGSILPAARATAADPLAAPLPLTPSQLTNDCIPSFDGRRAIILDCVPGFATTHDRVVVYPRAGVDPSGDPWAQLDDNDAVWLVEPGATARVALLIDFHRDAAGKPVADLYDDGDGDHNVEYIVSNGVPVAVEHAGRWTVRVTSRDAAWIVDGSPSANLDILVDGPVRASFGSADFVGLLDSDGHPDFEIHVRDTNNDGRPDLEWRQFYPPLSEDPRFAGHIRTEITATTGSGEAPMAGSLLWPFLAQVPQLYLDGRYVRTYGENPAPIEVDWTDARIVEVSEVVGARSGPGSYSIYSINRVTEGTTNASNFENPSALYDLAGAGDGWPDLSIRFEATLPGELLTPQRNANPVNVIEYSWDQHHDHNWTYALSLVGHQTVHDTIQFPGFAVRAVPSTALPQWVTGQTWDAATFVQVAQPYPATAPVRDYSVRGADGRLLPLRYLAGLDPAPPVGAFSQIPVGFRGEYTFDLNGRTARLYLSPVDLQLHLMYAAGGVWNLGGGRELRFESLAGTYIDHWTLRQDGTVIAGLHVLGDQVVFASGDGVSVGKLRQLADPTPLRPPADHASWSALGGLLAGSQPPFAPDDLAAMFGRIATSVQKLPFATAIGTRLTDGGFRFVLGLRDAPAGVKWAAGHAPGNYLATYQPATGYVLAPLTPAALAVGPADVAGGEARASEPVELSADVRNSGHTDGLGVRVVFQAGRDLATMKAVGTVVVDVPGDATARARVSWVPPSGGDWLIQAVLPGSDGAGPLTARRVAASPDTGSVAVLGAEHVPVGPLFAAAALLLIGMVGASASASRFLRR